MRTAQPFGHVRRNCLHFERLYRRREICNKTYKISDDSDGVTFVTDSHGDISEINGLAGSVEGNVANKISVNGKAVRLTGASSITADDKTYRKDVHVQIGDDRLTLEDAQGESFRINDYTAKVDATKLAFDDAANFYVATDHNATLTVGDIKTLDASKSQVNVELAGNDLDNKIIGGCG